MQPPSSSTNRAPEACDTIDIAGIGENPAIRSGPCVLMVCTCAAAIISVASSHVARTSPPRPRADLYRRARSGSDTTCAQAATGSPVRAFASRYISSSTPRTYGYRTRVGEYVYQENAAPRGQPRGSYSGESGPTDG